MLTKQNKKTVAISIVTWNSQNEIRECLASLTDLPENWEVWVVDNNSGDKTVEIIKSEFPNINLIVNEDNTGFAAANNQIILNTKTDYVMTLNPDTVSDKEEFLKLLEIIEANPKMGVIGPQLHDGEGNIQVVCDYFPYVWKNSVEALGLYRFFSAEWKSENLMGNFYDHQSERKVEWILGACLLVRREAVEKVGGIPEDYFMFAEAMHWCYLMWQNGFEVWFTNRARVLHKKNRSASQLPSAWRIEKSVLCKYVFCYSQFGWTKTKLIKLTDLLSYQFGIWRLKFGEPQPQVVEYWSICRKLIWSALWMSAKETSAKQLKV